MRFVLFILSLLVFLLVTSYISHATNVWAVTPTKTTATPTPTPIVDEKVSEFKERIATQVAKLNIIKKRGIIGTISDLANNQLTLEDMRANRRFIDVDELTKFTEIGGKQIGISDLKKGETTTVIGLYNTESRRLTARFIKVEKLLERIRGEVTDIDKKTFTLEVVDLETKETKIIEVETTTKTSELTKEREIVKSGFSKIQVNERIFVVGLSKKGEEGLTASRILLMPEFSPNLKASPTATPTPQKTPTPTATITPRL